MIDDVLLQAQFEMLPSSWAPARGNSPPDQFRLRLKTNYQDVTEEMRLVESTFVAAFVDI